MVLTSLKRLIGRRAVDWSRGSGRPPAIPPGGVDIVVPVHGAHAALARCLTSVAARTDLGRHRLRLVIDGPQPDDVERVIAEFLSEHQADIDILRNGARCGFAAAANAGMRASGKDVVLLNSDTIVTRQWIEKLISAAYSCADVATVTPLSNHATICSVPQPFRSNDLPAGYDVDSFADLVERVSGRTYPRIPTGVGFCLYLRRAALDDVGLFDERRFPTGYGEENDFCFRALARGWLHVADDATFIYHEGGASFGSETPRLQQEGAKTLRRLHPRYDATIARAMRDESISAVTATIRAALEERTPS